MDNEKRDTQMSVPFYAVGLNLFTGWYACCHLKL